MSFSISNLLEINKEDIKKPYGSNKEIIDNYVKIYSRLAKFYAILMLSVESQDILLSSELGDKIEKYLLELSDKNAINIIQSILPTIKLSNIDFLFKDFDVDKTISNLEKLKTYIEPQIVYFEEYLLDELRKDIMDLAKKLDLFFNIELDFQLEFGYKNFLIGKDETRNESNKLSNIKEVLVNLNGKSKVVSLSPLIYYDEDNSAILIYSSIISSFPVYERVKDGERIVINERLIVEDVANFMMKCHAYNLAIELYKKLIEDYPDGSNYKSSLYAAYCYLGSFNYKNNNFEKAAEAFESAMEIKDTMPQLYYNLSIVYSKLNLVDKAIKTIRKLIIRDTDNQKAYEMLGDLYAKIQQWQHAKALYERSEQISSNEVVRKKIKKMEENLKSIKQSGEKKEQAQELQELEKIIIDMNLQAELGKYQVVIGRDKELRHIIEILSCSHKNSLLIIGDPGVGKTALVEAFAIMLIFKNLPPALQDKKLFNINIGQLLAGAKFRGQLEERIINIFQNIKQKNGILFIDDIHNIFSSTAKGSASDIASILRGWILQGDVQCIGTTNYDEYRNSFEKDSSVLRCFQILRLEELSCEDTIEVLVNRSKKLEAHHRVKISMEAIERCVELSKKCLRERFLPDKAIEVMDRTAARAALISMKQEKIVDIPLICQVVSDLSGIPLGKLTTDEKELFINLENKIREKIVGQDDALSVIARVLRTAKANMELNPNRPRGVFLFIGPTGVGKTEVAKVLAELLFGTTEKLVRIDMSEYMERYSASRLIGTSPGYVGYYDQNQLVDKIRINPYSLILLDEIDKADPQLLHLFLQVFDAGRLTDGRGKIADFSNCILIMTSNAGTQLFSRTRLGYDTLEEHTLQVTKSELVKEIKRVFSAEFLNRIDEIVFFRPLNHDDIKKITMLKLRKVQENLNVEDKKLVLTDEALSFIASHGYSFEYGARNLERVIRRVLLDPLAVLTYHSRWNYTKEIHISLKNNRLFFSLLPEEDVSESKERTKYLSTEINSKHGKDQNEI